MAPVERERALLLFIGGRWRELPQGCSFAVARNGRLEELRPGPVRAALKRLQVGQPSKASLGPSLPFQKVPPMDRTSSETVIIQTKQTRQPSVNVHSAKRRRSTTSSEEAPPNITTVATIHNSKPPAKQLKTPSNPKLHANQLSNTSSDSNRVFRPMLKRKRRSSDEITILKSSKQQILKSPTLRLKRKPLIRRKYSSKENSPILQSKDLSEKQISRYLQKKPRRLSPKRHSISTDSDSEIERQEKRKGPSRQIFRSKEKETETKRPKTRPYRPNLRTQTKQNISIDLDSESEDSISKEKPSKKKKPIEEHSSETDKSVPIKAGLPKPALDEPKLFQNIFLKSSTSKGTKLTPSQQIASKELVIQEEDIELLRNFLQKHYSDNDLLRFDMDDEFKKMHFFRINPLVNIEHCPQISRILRNSQDSQITLADFASKLGLQSKSEASSVKSKRYKMRKEGKKSYVDSDSSDISDKENLVESSKNGDKVTDNRLSNKQLKSNKNNNANDDKIKELESKRSKTAENNKNRIGNDAGRRKELSSESGEEKRTKVLKNPPKPRPVISSKRKQVSKEYSSLEDQAIVAWVSTGGRASRVNGNVLWRQLQDQFYNITAIRRTWHSLRNRYLRYILPKLGELALPLSQQTRLRAAAATGELKARKATKRRNSIFQPPTRGAASRRPALGQTHDKEPELPSRRSPRYSSLTRQFNRRHRLRQPSSERSLSSARDPTNTDKGSSPRQRKPDKVKTPQKNINNSDTDSSESPRSKTNELIRTQRTITESKSNESRRSRRGATRDSSELSNESPKQPVNTRRSIRNSQNESKKAIESQRTFHKRKREESDSKDSSESSDDSSESDRRKSSRNKTDSFKSRRKLKKFRRNSTDRSVNNKDTVPKRSTFGRVKLSSNDSSRNQSPSQSRLSRKQTRPIQSSSSSESVSSPPKSLEKKNDSPKKRARNNSESSQSVSQTRRKSSRMSRKDPNIESNRRKSNRLVNSVEKLKPKPLDPNESIVLSDSSDEFESKKIKSVRSKKRKLYNPKVML